jgi:hypothetical protein
VIGTSSVVLAQLSRFYLKTETESRLRNVFLIKSRMVFWIKTERCLISRNMIFVIFVMSVFILYLNLNSSTTDCYVCSS